MYNLHVSYMSKMFNLHVSYMYKMFNRHVSYMYKMFNLHVSYMYKMFNLHVSYMYNTNITFFRCLWQIDIKSVKSISCDFFLVMSNGLCSVL